MRHTILLSASLAALLALAAPAWAGMEEDCEQDGDTNRQLSGCTAVIDSGQYSGVDLAVAYSNRGVAHRKLGDLARAIEDYDQALRLDPDHAAAYNNRGIAYSNLGQYDRAIADYDQALLIDPSLAWAYQNRGVSYEYLGDNQRAVEDWERAIRVDGASRTEWWQKYMKSKGHYAGAVDGVFTPSLRHDLLACAIDPAC